MYLCIRISFLQISFFENALARITVGKKSNKTQSIFILFTSCYLEILWGRDEEFISF